MKIFALLASILMGGLLIYSSENMPGWGDPNSPASRHVSPRYLEKSLQETGTPNVVTSVLADYRSYDTLGEAAVIFSAGMACILLLRRRRRT